MAALIEIRDLSISANGKQILKNINLDINEGDSIGIIGKSGAGKTTLSKIIAGIMERDSGKVDVRIGDIWVDMTEKGTDFIGRAKPHIGYLHQEYSLYPHRNVLSGSDHKE